MSAPAPTLAHLNTPMDTFHCLGLTGHCAPINNNNPKIFGPVPAAPSTIDNHRRTGGAWRDHPLTNQPPPLLFLLADSSSLKGSQDSSWQVGRTLASDTLDPRPPPPLFHCQRKLAWLSSALSPLRWCVKLSGLLGVRGVQTQARLRCPPPPPPKYDNRRSNSA